MREPVRPGNARTDRPTHRQPGRCGAAHANSLARLQAFGVLKLTLGASSYSWQLVNESGAVLDSGSGTCH